jgi:hypothetical protein
MPQGRHRAPKIQRLNTNHIFTSAFFTCSILFLISLTITQPSTIAQSSSNTTTPTPTIITPTPTPTTTTFYGPLSSETVTIPNPANRTKVEKDQDPIPTTASKATPKPTTKKAPATTTKKVTSTTPLPLPPPPPPPPVKANAGGSSSFGGVASHVAIVGNFLQARFNVKTVGGRQSRPNNPTSDHPKGLALDFIITGAQADALNKCALANKEAWNITYTLWQVPAHYDHVHISFQPAPQPDPTNLSC